MTNKDLAMYKISSQNKEDFSKLSDEDFAKTYIKTRFCSECQIPSPESECKRWSSCFSTMTKWLNLECRKM